MSFRSICPLNSVVEIIGDKWTLLIVRDLFLGKKRFSELIVSKEKIARNILTNRLKKLKKFGLIGFKRLAGNKKEKHYFLTNKGLEIYPTIIQMMIWGDKNVPESTGNLGQKILKNYKLKGPEKIINDFKNKSIPIDS
tara:strand:+ start:144 stop:557 length:414 start_codon:yes stop_codon:yes gene_type:complete